MSDIGTELPENPKPAQNRFLLAIVIALGALIVLGLGALIAGIALGGNTHSDEATAAAPATTTAAQKARKPVSMHLADGYKILSTETQPGRLILHIRSTTQDEIDIIDLDNGQVISQIHAAAPQ